MSGYKRLDLIMLSEPRGCGYYYLVQRDCMAYTAFRTYKALRIWMDDRGLTAKLDHRSRGRAIMTLHGDFREIMATDQAAWDAIIPVRTVPFLSNGSYTLAKIHYDGNLRLLTYLHPNVRTRPTLDHADTEQALDSGADLVEWMTNEIEALKPDGELRARAVNGSPADDAPKVAAPKCDMRKDCPEPVAYIDIKGFVYCGAHGKARKDSVRCRKLKPAELAKLKAGEPLAKY